MFKICRIRPPECGLGDPARLAQHARIEAECGEHFHRPAGNAVGLAELQRARLLVDNADLDLGKSRKLGRERQPRRPAADNQDIHLIRQRIET
jgi:hypothetical protein